MGITEIQAVLSDVRFTGFVFRAVADGRGELYLCGEFFAADTCNGGAPQQWRTRRWLLSPVMTKSELVQTAFKCVLTAVEHEAREEFTYRRRPIFGPHYDVDVLWNAAGAPLAERVA